ncbi:MAG: ABC transporter ATP-binding protein [Clostridia bacterium]
MKLVECKNLCKDFDNKQILKNINLTIPRGKIIGLLGKNGMGKTTLIKLINDLLTPTRGEVLINGERPGVNSKKIISYLPERTYLDKSMTIAQVFKFFEEFYDNFNKEKAIKLLKDLDLELDKKISQMSKGMQEKLQLILVMSREAQLYILDEPLGGVDPATRDYILDTILSNFNEGASVIISTHLIADIERILDEVIFIDKGEVILTSPADELRKKENASIDEIFRRCFKC